MQTERWDSYVINEAWKRLLIFHNEHTDISILIKHIQWNI